MDCGCAGCFSAPYALALYAQAFESMGRLDCLADFASRFGAQFYGLPVSDQTIRLIRQPDVVVGSLPYGVSDQTIVPLAAGETLDWQLVQ